MTIRIVILGAAPLGSDQEVPVWLAEQGGELFLERQVRMLKPLDGHFVFAVRAEDMRRYHLNNVIRLAAPGSDIVPIRGATAGASCTALLCIEYIDPDAELLILAGNEYLDIDYADAVMQFRQRGLDAAVVVFPSLHPRYSYVRLDDEENIVEAAEKNPISRLAAAGFTWFRHGRYFIDSAKTMIRKGAEHGGGYFINPSLNELILQQKRLGILQVEAKRYIPLKSRKQVDMYESVEDSV